MNPSSRGLGAVSWRRPMTLVPVVITGGISAVMTGATPALVTRFFPTIDMSNAAFKYGSQALMAFGGGWLLHKFVGGAHGLVWTIVGLAVIGGEILAPFLAQAGLATYPVDTSDVYSYMGTQGGRPGSDYFLPSRVDEGVPIGGFADMGAYVY